MTLLNTSKESSIRAMTSGKAFLKRASCTAKGSLCELTLGVLAAGTMSSSKESRLKSMACGWLSTVTSGPASADKMAKARFMCSTSMRSWSSNCAASTTTPLDNSLLTSAGVFAANDSTTYNSWETWLKLRWSFSGSRNEKSNDHKARREGSDGDSNKSEECMAVINSGITFDKCPIPNSGSGSSTDFSTSMDPSMHKAKM
mmetsp:Transcript_11879/g.27045  ORF Transcript_11879/g.27045 Transcript_11879/m.27045 type:complete len:201 (+) Transcript_11879:1332-1934(+)